MLRQDKFNLIKSPIVSVSLEKKKSRSGWKGHSSSLTENKIVIDLMLSNKSIIQK